MSTLIDTDIDSEVSNNSCQNTHVYLIYMYARQIPNAYPEK